MLVYLAIDLVSGLTSQYSPSPNYIHILFDILTIVFISSFLEKKVKAEKLRFNYIYINFAFYETNKKTHVPN